MASTAKKIRVAYEGRKKVLSIPQEDVVSSLKWEFCVSFRVDKTNNVVTFQRYNSDFEEYIDIESDCELSHTEKLQAVVTTFNTNILPKNSGAPSSLCGSDFIVSPCALASSPIVNKSSRKRSALSILDDEVESNDNGAEGSTEEDGNDDGGYGNLNIIDNDDHIGISPTTPNRKVSSKTKVVKTESDKFPLPDPYPLPKHYSHRIESSLASGRLTKKEKQSFITEVASSMLRYKRYPDREDYACVARTVISKYPFLKPSSGNPYDVIIRSLMNRFKEFRREKRIRLTPLTPKVAPAVECIKQKSPGIVMIPSYPTSMPGEDKTSYERHTKSLQVQFKKSQKNYAIIKELMERSFSFRRVEILDNSLSLREIFEKFPFLQEIDMLIMEMEFIAKSKALRESSLEQWTLKRVKIVEQVRLESSRHTSRFSSALPSDDGINMSLHALSVLPFLLPDVRVKADPNKILYFAQDCTNLASVAEDAKMVTLYVLVTKTIKEPGQAFLVVDKQIINEINNLDNIPLVLLSAYFVFNIQYPMGCNNFFSFLEVLLLNFPITKSSITVKHLFTSI